VKEQLASAEPTPASDDSEAEEEKLASAEPTPASDEKEKEEEESDTVKEEQAD
jgi:hypothetical protein